MEARYYYKTGNIKNPKKFKIMKNSRILQLILIFTLSLTYSSCKKEDDKPTETTTTTPTAVKPTVTATTVFTDNTVGYLGGSVESVNISFFGVQGVLRLFNRSRFWLVVLWNNFRNICFSLLF